MLDDELVRKACAFELFSEHVFLDRQLLFDAVMSKGYPNEHKNDGFPKHRQGLLANMGDAVIDVLATEHLICVHGIEKEGEVTSLRQDMVNGDSLNDLAENVVEFIAMTSGEWNELGRSSTPAESLEAMVGALYLDGGLTAARTFLDKLGFFEKDH